MCRNCRDSPIINYVVETSVHRRTPNWSYVLQWINFRYHRIVHKTGSQKWIRYHRKRQIITGSWVKLETISSMTEKERILLYAPPGLLLIQTPLRHNLYLLSQRFGDTMFFVMVTHQIVSMWSPKLKSASIGIGCTLIAGELGSSSCSGIKVARKARASKDECFHTLRVWLRSRYFILLWIFVQYAPFLSQSIQRFMSNNQWKWKRCYLNDALTSYLHGWWIKN